MRQRRLSLCDASPDTEGHMRPILATFLPAFLMLAPVLTVAADDSVEEYRRRFAAVAVDDVSGHLRLARWCRSGQLWELLAAQWKPLKAICQSKFPPDLGKE